MHVAFVTVGDTSRLTGGYLYHDRVFTKLREEGMEVEEIVASGAFPAEQEEATAGLGSRLDLRRFDVVVVDALARVACAPWIDRWRASCPVVAMIHELPSVAATAGYGVIREQEFEEPLLRTDRLITVSEHGSSILQSRGVPAERIRVVSPGFDHLSPPDAHTQTSVRDGSPVHALCVAQWILRKDILGLVRAWTAQERPGVTLELIGETDADPAYAASVHAAIADAPESSICVRGSVDDSMLGAAYANADLFVLPSRYEGYGIVYAEALALGLPVIACDVGPILELVGEEAAILVPPGDTETLSEALDLLLRDPTLRLRMSNAARHRAAHLPRWKDTVAGFRRVLQEALVEARQTGLPPLRKLRSLREEERKSVAHKDLREQNRVSWNAVVRVHDSHRSNLAEFLREGGNTLFPEERALLGDLDGKTLAHLQCNSGSDSLSLAQLRAVVTGVDISDEAVSSARELSSKSGISAVFVRGDVYDWLAVEARKEPRFDVVYGSYGVVCWLPNLETWAEGIAAILRPGGRFVLVDFHPTAMMFDEHWAHAHDYYSGGEPLIEEEGIGDYVAKAGGGLTPAGFVEGVRNFRNPHRCHLFRWGLGEVVTAVAGAGLRITVLEEYPYSNGERHFAGMRELPERRMVPPQRVPTVPLMYGISACKD